MCDVIKPCPFCGSEANVYSNYNHRSNCYFVYCKCSMCNAQSGGVYHSKCTQDMTDEEFWTTPAVFEAIKKWNTRIGKE